MFLTRITYVYSVIQTMKTTIKLEAFIHLAQAVALVLPLEPLMMRSSLPFVKATVQQVRHYVQPI